MNRSYLITLLKVKLDSWKEYLKRPALPEALSFRAADMVWSECKRAWCDVELAQVAPIEKVHPSMSEMVQKPPRRSEKQIIDELGFGG